MSGQISVNDASVQELVRDAEEGKATVLCANDGFGTPTAVILPAALYERMVAAVETDPLLDEDPNLMADLQQAVRP